MDVFQVEQLFIYVKHTFPRRITDVNFNLFQVYRRQAHQNPQNELNTHSNGIVQKSKFSNKFTISCLVLLIVKSRSKCEYSYLEKRKLYVDEMLLFMEAYESY